MMKEMTPKELKQLRDEGRVHQLVDVREAYEAERCTLGGELIPMGEIIDRLEELRRDVPVIIHCRSGTRSATVVQALAERHGRPDLINLKGGILAYAQEVDPSLSCDG